MTAQLFPQGALPDETAIFLSRSTWMTAALGALALHAAAGALAFHYLQSDAADSDLGAPAIEISVDLMSPHRDETELPIGPDIEASAPAPAVVEQKEVDQKSELPKDVPVESDDAMRMVAPVDPKKPKDDDPKITSIQAQPSESSVAAEATAVPVVKSATQSPRSAAPALGTSASAVRERVTWEKELAVHFDKYKRYPADRAAENAEVVVRFTLDRMGHVVSSSIVKGSGDVAFDTAALSMLQRSDPVPAPPPLVADHGLTFSLPVIFHVKQR